MILTDATLADICRRAGFAGDGTVDAIACALAASGAQPNFEVRTGFGPAAHYRGLWGVDVVDWPEYADHELDNPYAAAQVAHELTTATRGWRWCPAYRSGASGAFLGRARTSALAIPRNEPHLEPVSAVPILSALRERMLDLERRRPGAAANPRWEH